MNGKDICQALGDQAVAYISFINKLVGSKMLYLESDLGFFRLYSNESGHDEMILDGRNSIGGLTKLVLTLQAILGACGCKL